MAKSKAPKAKLLGSSPSREGIVKVITAFYCGSSIRLTEEGEGEFAVHNAIKELLGVRVIQKKGRYRFESIL